MKLNKVLYKGRRVKPVDGITIREVDYTRAEAYLGEEYVGHIIHGYTKHSTFLYLKWVEVEKAYRGLGIATMLIDYITSKRKNKQYILLYPTNTTLKKGFYDKFTYLYGFRYKGFSYGSDGDQENGKNKSFFKCVLNRE